MDGILQHVQEVWWSSFLLTTIFIALMALAYFARGRLIELLTSGRFFMTSVLVHVLIVFLLAAWSLPAVVEVVVSKIQEASAFTQPFHDRQHQSHEPGDKAWEKLADLKAIETSDELVRKEVQPLNIPQQSERIEPTISLEMARFLPSERIWYVPADEPATPRAVGKMSERTLAPPTAVIEFDDPTSPAVPVVTDKHQVSQANLPQTQATSFELPQNTLPLPSADLPLNIGGPASPDRELSIGELGTELVDVPPALSPHASLLPRERARAKRVIFAEDSVGMQEMFSLRQGDIRKEHIELFGGSPASESAVNLGLEWLKTHQSASGSWSLNHFHENCRGKHGDCPGAGNLQSNTAATGLALLPFLAAGHTHQSGDYQQQVGLASKWLIAQQKENGDLLSNGDQHRMYSHSLAAIALCELYGMTHDPQLEAPIRKTLDFIVQSQHRGSGGWRYEPNQHSDTSVVGWAVMALKSGEMAGIAIPPETVANAQRWLQSVEGNKPTGGLFGYQDTNPTPAMTAEGLLCLQFIGDGRNSPRLRAGADYLLQNLPQPDKPLTSYYWYYGTQVMYHMQGNYWQAWNGKLRDHLVATQIKDGSLAGTWNPQDQWEQSGGRIYATSLRLLMLEVYYRHLPLYNSAVDE